MNDIVSDYIMLGVNILLWGVFIVMVLTTVGIFTEMNNSLAEQEESRKVMQESVQYKMWDQTYVEPQDIVSAIYQYRGEPAVKVIIISTSSTYEWSLISKACDYSADEISKLIERDSSGKHVDGRHFKAEIEYAPSGAVKSIIFTECTAASHSH
mgnify:FL=1